MAFGKGHAVFHAHGWKLLAGVQEVPDFGEDPGMAKAGTAHHDAVYAVALKSFLRFLCTVDVSITYYRYVHAGVLFHGTDEGPVGLALVHLAAGAAMDGEGGNAHILQALG